MLLIPLATATLGLVAQTHWCKGEIDRIARAESSVHPSPLKDLNAAPDRGFDIHYQRLELQIDPAVREVHGTVIHHFTALEELEGLMLDLSSQLQVLEVVHSLGPVTHTHASDLLYIQLNDVLPAGTSDSISITYGGVPPEAGLGSFMQAEHDGSPVIWTLSQPYGARDWWPCKQDLQDKADSVDVLVTTTAANKVAGNGLLASVAEMPGGNVRYHWRHRYPIAYYLIAIAVTNYEVFNTAIELPDATVPMETWAYPEDAFDMQMNAADIQQQMPLFSELFGPYPFLNEKYGHAQFSWGGGMEHQTMTFMGGFSFELAAHELAHQWFGNKVTCGSWEDIWLNEGFASYLSGLCYDMLAPEYWHDWKQAQIDDIVSVPYGSVKCTDTTDIGRLFSPRLSYRKGAFVLHMLRWILGDDLFFEGCRNYLNDPALAYSTARTHDLQQHLENVSGLDLDGFFQDWYHGEGHPSYLLEWTQDPGGGVEMALWQSPSHSSVDHFELPVPVGLSDGQRDTVVVLDHHYSGQVFNVHLPFQVSTASIDPGLWLISGQNVVIRVPRLGMRNGAIIHPNPVEEELHVLFGTDWSGLVDVRVVDGRGRIHVDRRMMAENRSLSIPLHTAAAGMYVLELEQDQRLVRERFIKR